MNPNVLVIGSGLSAIGAIRALLEQGIKPTVIDWGDVLDEQRTELVNALAKKEPGDWTAEDRKALNSNASLSDGSKIPKKLVFGSDFFYGKSREKAPLKAEGNTPPFSYALGGFSVGWGAAVLPPQACDIADWPLDVEELTKYCEKLIADLPYSACDDGLSLNFPVLTDKVHGLVQSQAEMQILEAFQKRVHLKKNEHVFGQARLLVNPNSSNGAGGCRYCGQCMSGCVYKAIYKSSDEIMTLHNKGQIHYISGCLVDSLSEHDEKVTIKYFDSDCHSITSEFDRVYLAAGAVNSTRVVLNSLSLFNETVELKTRGGFVIPILSLRKFAVDWPNCNTQPGIFLEMKGRALKHWVHVQISTENELLLQKLKSHVPATGMLECIKKFIASHIILSLVNYHSDHAGRYQLWLTPASQSDSPSCLQSRHIKFFPQFPVLFASWFKLFSIFIKIGCIPLFPFAKLNSGAYHVGASLPMKARPTGKLETDILGRVSAWQRVHIVDTSTFPSLPGTTIGLLAMANAYRIVEKVSGLKIPDACA